MAEDQVELQVTIRNKYGLHARPAALFVEMCNRFASEVEVQKDGVCVNGKNILDIMTLGAANGTELTIRVQGADAGDASQNINSLFENNFGEE